mmetsp:Transcript_18831/g.24239  ORF Transcript_18831/g.24239 Transcript_18831/m.24239 type:complete len:320 (+) Transcript_18831:119-1078(+)
MKLLLTKILLLGNAGLAVAFVQPNQQAFVPGKEGGIKADNDQSLSLPKSTLMDQQRPAIRTQIAAMSQKKLSMSPSSQSTDETEKSWAFNPLFASLWVGFFAFAALGPGELFAPSDTELINNYIADPSNPGFSQVFQAIFNYLGVMPMVIACLAIPQGSKKGLPALPFIAASFGLGYGAIGPYLSFRAPPKTYFDPSEASWFTRNIVDSKILGWGLVAAVVSLPFVVGLVDAVAQDSTSTIKEYLDLFATSKLCSASSMDAVILNIVAAVLIPQDLKLRTNVEDSKAKAIAASTLLFPFLGAALYCALRPSLPSFDEEN